MKKVSFLEKKQNKAQASRIQSASLSPFFVYFHNIVTISVPSVKVKTIRSSLYTVT